MYNILLIEDNQAEFYEYKLSFENYFGGNKDFNFFPKSYNNYKKEINDIYKDENEQYYNIDNLYSYIRHAIMKDHINFIIFDLNINCSLNKKTTQTGILLINKLLNEKKAVYSEIPFIILSGFKENEGAIENEWNVSKAVKYLYKHDFNSLDLGQKLLEDNLVNLIKKNIEYYMRKNFMPQKKNEKNKYHDLSKEEANKLSYREFYKKTLNERTLCLELYNALDNNNKEIELIPNFQPILTSTEIDQKNLKEAKKYEVLSRIIKLKVINIKKFKPIRKDFIYSLESFSSFQSPIFFYLKLANKYDREKCITKKILIKSFEKLKNNKEKHLSFNLSDTDFKNFEEIIQTVKDENDKLKYGIKEEQITFEILEEVRNDSKLKHQIKKIKEKGFKVALDDFGKEHSNQSKLNDLIKDLDFVKIDGDFVKNSYEPKNGESSNIEDKLYFNKALVSMLQDIILGYELKSMQEGKKQKKIKIVVEHISDETLLKTFSILGVDNFQGFHLGKPSNDFKIITDSKEKVKILNYSKEEYPIPLLTLLDLKSGQPFLQNFHFYQRNK